MSENTIPTAAGALPVVGHTLRLLRAPLSFLSSLPEQGELVKVRLGPFEALVVSDPELTRQVLLNDRSFDKGGEFYQRVSESLGNGLSTSRHDAHRRQAVFREH
jgi:hypothetical protein